jgi:peptidoglycan/xylan/chitin deacetylase (PgdA/CDA1 family)
VTPPIKVSLTFDNGPDAQLTPLVLDILARYDIRATFFPLGMNLALPPLRALAARAFAEGHRIGNHSFHHATPFGLLQDAEEAVREILSTDALIGDLGGSERLFRPFGRAQVGPHLLNAAAWKLLIERKFTCVLWNCIAPERSSPDAWMEPTLTMCRQRTWSVVVMHDIPQGGVLKLPDFIDRLVELGVEFSQDFPPECTPLRYGVPIGKYEHLMPAPGNRPDPRFIAPTY